MSKTPIHTPAQLTAALGQLSMTRDDFVEVLGKHGIRVTTQAVWKWTRGKTQRVPGYVGFFLLKEFDISSESLKLN